MLNIHKILNHILLNIYYNLKIILYTLFISEFHLMSISYFCFRRFEIIKYKINM